MTRIPPCNSIPLLVVFVLIAASSVALPAQPNYDLPQPSAEFGTPEATAKIGAKVGRFDAVGIKRGISLKAVHEAVKAPNPTITLESTVKFECEALPGVAITPAFAGQSQTVDGRSEFVGAVVTSAPSDALILVPYAVSVGERRPGRSFD